MTRSAELAGGFPAVIVAAPRDEAIALAAFLAIR
jgi:hypothetical protein